jgi:hypothetical protein
MARVRSTTALLSDRHGEGLEFRHLGALRDLRKRMQNRVYVQDLLELPALVDAVLSRLGALLQSLNESLADQFADGLAKVLETLASHLDVLVAEHTSDWGRTYDTLPHLCVELYRVFALCSDGDWPMVARSAASLLEAMASSEDMAVILGASKIPSDLLALWNAAEAQSRFRADTISCFVAFTRSSKLRAQMIAGGLALATLKVALECGPDTSLRTACLQILWNILAFPGSESVPHKQHSAIIRTVVKLLQPGPDNPDPFPGDEVSRLWLLAVLSKISSHGTGGCHGTFVRSGAAQWLHECLLDSRLPPRERIFVTAISWGLCTSRDSRLVIVDDAVLRMAITLATGSGDQGAPHVRSWSPDDRSAVQRQAFSLLRGLCQLPGMVKMLWDVGIVGAMQQCVAESTEFQAPAVGVLAAFYWSVRKQRELASLTQFDSPVHELVFDTVVGCLGVAAARTSVETRAMADMLNLLGDLAATSSSKVPTALPVVARHLMELFAGTGQRLLSATYDDARYVAAGIFCLRNLFQHGATSGLTASDQVASVHAVLDGIALLSKEDGHLSRMVIIQLISTLTTIIDLSATVGREATLTWHLAIGRPGGRNASRHDRFQSLSATGDVVPLMTRLWDQSEADIGRLQRRRTALAALFSVLFRADDARSAATRTFRPLAQLIEGVAAEHLENPGPQSALVAIGCFEFVGETLERIQVCKELTEEEGVHIVPRDARAVAKLIKHGSALIAWQEQCHTETAERCVVLVVLCGVV